MQVDNEKNSKMEPSANSSAVFIGYRKQCYIFSVKYYKKKLCVQPYCSRMVFKIDRSVT